ncbi:MAG: hypothetical protein KC535_02485 [Nanoarchaeota archaeon]|nr:hypothetical protein [Nanoarchaeota archaeon]
MKPISIDREAPYMNSFQRITYWLKNGNEDKLVREASTRTYKKIATDVFFDRFNLEHKVILEAKGIQEQFRPLGYLRLAYKRFYVNIDKKMYKITPQINEDILKSLEEEFDVFKEYVTREMRYQKIFRES